MTSATAPVTPAAEPVDPDDVREDPSPTIVARAALSVLAFAAIVIAVVGGAVGLDLVRNVGVVVFCLWGIGSAPLSLRTDTPLPARLAWTFVLSLSTLTFGALLMSVLGQWHPLPLFVPVSLVVLGLHGLSLARIRQELDLLSPTDRARALRSVLEPFGRSSRTAAGLVGGGVLLSLLTALLHRGDPFAIAGFLPVVGPSWYVGLALVLAGLVVSVREDDERVTAVAVVALMLVLTLTPAIFYGMPINATAEKHVDLMRQITTFGHIDSQVSAYNAWPGFFAAMAWMCDVAGIRDALNLATWWPALIGLSSIPALRYFAGQVLRTRSQAWVAVTLAVLANAIGADYFSPQSIGYVVALVAFGLALDSQSTWLRTTLLVTAGSVISVSHQLTPYVLSGTLILLVVLRQVKPWWTPLLTLGPTMVWTVLHRDVLGKFLNLGQIGRLENFKPPTTIGSSGLERLPIVAQSSRALALGILVLGLFALITLWRTRRSLRSWAFLACPGVGLGLVAVNPYGNEGIFRAALFAIPWLAVMAAPAFFHAGGTFIRILFAVVATGLTATFLVASYGLDAGNVVRRSDVSALRIYKDAGGYASDGKVMMLTIGDGLLPTSPPLSNYAHVTIGRDQIDVPVTQVAAGEVAALVPTITRAYATYAIDRVGTGPLYALWSPASSFYGWEYGLQTPEQFAELRDAFTASGYWTVVSAEDGSVLYRFDPAKFAAKTQ